MYANDESVRMAQKFIDNVLDAEEALKDGELAEVQETLRTLKEQMMFVISENQYKGNPLMVIDSNDLIH